MTTGNDTTFWSNLKYWLRKRKVMRQCGNICYCPNCREILNDTAQHFDRGLNQDVYICAVCDWESVFSFDLAPVPILMSSLPPDTALQLQEQI